MNNIENRCSNNLEKGGREYQIWIYKILKLLGWEPKDDIKLMAYNKLFIRWKQGMTPENAIRDLKKKLIYRN